MTATTGTAEIAMIAMIVTAAITMTMTATAVGGATAMTMINL